LKRTDLPGFVVLRNLPGERAKTYFLAARAAATKLPDRPSVARKRLHGTYYPYELPYRGSTW
jgi:hypothetical protein